jgi:hypothetical protein
MKKEEILENYYESLKDNFKNFKELKKFLLQHNKSSIFTAFDIISKKIKKIESSGSKKELYEIIDDKKLYKLYKKKQR